MAAGEDIGNSKGQSGEDAAVWVIERSDGGQMYGDYEQSVVAVVVGREAEVEAAVERLNKDEVLATFDAQQFDVVQSALVGDPDEGKVRRVEETGNYRWFRHPRGYRERLRIMNWARRQSGM